MYVTKDGICVYVRKRDSFSSRSAVVQWSNQEWRKKRNRTEQEKGKEKEKKISWSVRLHLRILNLLHRRIGLGLVILSSSGGLGVPPHSVRVLLAHREARDAEVVRDVVDNECTEAYVCVCGDAEGEIDEDGRVGCVRLNDWRPREIVFCQPAEHYEVLLFNTFRSVWGGSRPQRQ